MANTATTIDTYLAAYGEAGDDRRRSLIEMCFTPDAMLADPPFEANGHDGLQATFAAVLGHYPGHTFRRTSGIDEHHGCARFSWEFVAPDGTVAFAGTDFVRFDTDGLIIAVVGFFGPLPSRDD
jgi:hypothetical protein